VEISEAGNGAAAELLTGKQEREGHGFRACGKTDVALDFGWRSASALQ